MGLLQPLNPPLLRDDLDAVVTLLQLHCTLFPSAEWRARRIPIKIDNDKAPGMGEVASRSASLAGWCAPDIEGMVWVS